MIDIREMSVLVADDMENMFSAIRSIMRILGFGKKFQYVGNGADALAALKAGLFDLALLDNNMPGISGLELLSIIRGDKTLRDLPVIMITGHADREFITNAAESDIDAYILKPITVNLLKQKIPPIIERANNPSPMATHLKAAGRYEEQGNLDAAVHEAQCAVAANPDSTRPLRELGYYYIKKGDLEQAESCLLRAAAMNRLDVIACTHLGDLYLQKNDPDRALQYYVKAMKISPRNYERALNLGKLLIRKKMTAKAIPVLNKVFELSKDPLPLREEIASYCIAEGALDYAGTLLAGLIDQNRRRPDLLFKLGLVSEQCGRPDDALKHFIEAEQLDNKDITVKLHIAKNYIARGKVLFAEKPIRAVLKLDPENQEARQLLRKCI
jgi:CheY-like chemotaxis protein